MASLLDLLEGRLKGKSLDAPVERSIDQPPAATREDTPPLLTKAQRDVYLQQIRRVKLRRALKGNFEAFAKYFWPVLEPDVDLVWSWHLSALATELSAAPPNSKTAINVPPGTGKSNLFILFRAWRWANNAGYRFFSASYGAHLSVRDNVKLRNLIQSKEYQTLFPNVVVSGDQNAKEKFETTEGGWSIATSVGGTGTGEHPDYKFIDDPLSEKQSRSAVERAAANLWMDRTLSTRGLTRNVITFLIMQRLAEDDPTGHAIAQGGWNLIRFPMRFEKCTCRPEAEEVCPLHKADPKWVPDPRDIRTEPGQLLMPELFTEEKVRTVELVLGPYGTAGQLQQRPSPEGGGLFRREWFKIVDALPTVPKGKARWARGWDTAGTEGDGDWTVGVKLLQVEEAKPQGDSPGQYSYYVTSVVRAQTANVDKLIRATALADGKQVDQREEKEGGSAGIAVIAARANALRGFSYSGVPISGDKVTRAKPLRTQVEAGNVYLLRGEWNEAYLDELAHFPTGAHDDQVDASSCAFNALLLERPKGTRATWGRS